MKCWINFKAKVMDETSIPELLLKVDSDSSIFYRRTNKCNELVICCSESPFEHSSVKIEFDDASIFIESLKENSKILTEDLEDF